MKVLRNNYQRWIEKINADPYKRTMFWLISWTIIFLGLTLIGCLIARMGVLFVV